MSETVPAKVYEILKEVTKGTIDNFTIIVHNSNKKGEGYMGELFFICLRNKINGKELNLVVKRAFSQQNIREMFPIRDAFDNEIYFYRKLWPELSAFQKSITESLHFSQIANSLAASSESGQELFVLENLNSLGFVLHKKSNALEVHQLEFLFRVYGRLHAMSFAYKALHPVEFSVLASGMTDVWDKFSQMESFKNFVKLTCEKCLESLVPGLDDAVSEKFRHYIEYGVELFGKSLICKKYTCITHGDCWSNNNMFKYDDCGKLLDIRLLDFQMARVGSPICDLSYCLYSSGTKEIFDDMDRFIQIYHDTLSENLLAFGCDPEELYPLQLLKDDWKIHCQLGMIMGLSLWRAKLTYEDSAIDLSDVANEPGEISKFFKTKYDEKAFKKRTRDILVHTFERGYMF